ncbi:MAG: TetR/AcrR family transcriptional regulator [Bacteroidetes bacterium]|nr:TetR/AcrR family transcriptional regulator [Bacteroidota bacterium]
MEQIDKKAAILIEAEKLFAEMDFDAVSVRDLAKAANVNIAMISYYFGSKEKLFEELIISRMANSQTTIQSIATDPALSSIDKLMAVVDFYTDRLMNNPNVHRMINRELSSSNRPELRELLISKIETNKTYIGKMLEEGKANGTFREDADMGLVMINLFACIQYIVGSPYYSCKMLDVPTEAQLFDPEFRKRIKTYFKELFSHYLLKNQ